MMSRSNVESREFRIFERWARTEKAICIAALLGVLASVGIFYLLGGGPLVNGAVICLIAVLVAMPVHLRRVENIRRGKKILGRYSQQSTSRPLGL